MWKLFIFLPQNLAHLISFRCCRSTKTVKLFHIIEKFPDIITNQSHAQVNSEGFWNLTISFCLTNPGGSDKLHSVCSAFSCSCTPCFHIFRAPKALVDILAFRCVIVSVSSVIIPDFCWIFRKKSISSNNRRFQGPIGLDGPRGLPVGYSVRAWIVIRVVTVAWSPEALCDSNPIWRVRHAFDFCSEL